MPIYEYICNKCRENFSILLLVSTAEKDTKCPKCGSKDIKKKLSTFSCSISADAESSSVGPYSGFSGGG